VKPQELRAKIESLDAIPAISPVVRRLLLTVERPTASYAELGEIISKDQAITAKLLRMVNSPIYGFPGRISSVSQALILLGLHVVKGILLGLSVVEIMEKTMMGLWEHSLFTAIAAKTIALKKGVPEPEEVMTSALLHDIGKVALKINFPAEYDHALSLADSRDLLIRKAEDDIFGLNHSTAGGWLARQWNFPVTLAEPIAYHHKPALTQYAPEQTAIVHVADLLVRARGFGFGGDRLVPPVEPRVWESLRLSEEDIREVLDVLEDAAHSVEAITL
jgi:putative nucleotidyltransferase with HDIG domain